MAVWIGGRIVLAMVTLVALASMGGAAIFGSPILLPLLFLAALVSGRVGRGIFSVLAGLVVAEVVWAGVYVLVGEQPVVIWLVPLSAFAAATVGCFYVSGLGREANVLQHS